MKTILIIDDEKDLCELLKTTLRKDNFLVDCAYTLAEADSKINDLDVDIILLDNNLPDGSGLDYLSLHQSKFQKSKVVIITADPTPHIEKREDCSGVDAFINKPFNIGVLKDIIRRLA